MFHFFCKPKVNDVLIMWLTLKVVCLIEKPLWPLEFVLILISGTPGTLRAWRVRWRRSESCAYLENILDTISAKQSRLSIQRRSGQPRQRNQSKEDGRRKRKKCPENGCTGEVVNLQRHYNDCHKDIPRFEVDDIIENLKKTPDKIKPGT